MKKIILSITLSIGTFSGFTQSEKYVPAMKEKIAALDTLRDESTLKDMSAAFERIGDAEKTQWLPYYYAALSVINAGNFIYVTNPSNVEELQKIDPLAERAEKLLDKANALSQNNSEIYAAKKMAGTLRMMVDPMSRFMQYGAKAQEALEMAKKLNPDNPRIYLLEGQDKYFTPEQYGGSKIEAKRLFEEALKKFETFKPETDLHPHWGKDIVDYMMSQIK